MPFYTYLCPANGRQEEAMHGMSRTLTTWRELCEAAGLEPGDTPPDSPVEKVISGRIGTASGGGDAFTPAQGRTDGHSCGPGCSH